MKLSPQVERWLPTALWIIPLVFFGVLLFKYTALNGTYISIWRPGDKADLNVVPIGRASKPLQTLDTGEVFQRVTGDPVYLSMQVPRSFDSVTATVDFQNNGQPLIEFGLQTSEAWQFDLHPLDVPLIENLNWSKLTDDQGNILLQKQPTFSSIPDFLDHLPLNHHIAEYHQALTPPFVMTNYLKRPALDIHTPLRGSQLMKLYTQNEPVSIDLVVQDLNRAFDDDGVMVSLQQNDVVLAQATQVDDGDLVADGNISTTQTIHVETPNAVTGVVELHIDSTDDLLIPRLKTTVGYLVTQHLFLAGNTEYTTADQFDTQATSLTTNTRTVQAITSHPHGLQNLTVGELTLPLVKVNSTQQVNLPDDSMRVLTSPLNDVTVVSQGWMSFTPQSFFDPDYFIDQLTPLSNLDQMDYVYAADLPQHAVTDKTRSVTFDLSQLPGDKKHLNFMLSAPGLDQLKADYTVSGIRFEFHRPPLTLSGIIQRIKQRFHV